jgi:hypothetical protein
MYRGHRRLHQAHVAGQRGQEYDQRGAARQGGGVGDPSHLQRHARGADGTDGLHADGGWRGRHPGHPPARTGTRPGSTPLARATSSSTSERRYGRWTRSGRPRSTRPRPKPPRFTSTPASCRSRRWLAKARMRGDGPPYAKIGRSIRYRKHALVRGLKSRARLSMSESEQMAKNPLRLSYPGRNVAQTHFKGRTAKFIARQNVNENSQKVIRRSH